MYLELWGKANSTENYVQKYKRQPKKRLQFLLITDLDGLRLIGFVLCRVTCPSSQRNMFVCKSFFKYKYS